MPNYCESLKKERLKRGLTQEGMASLLGLKRSTYSLYESGKRVVSDSALQRIAAILDVSYYELSENDSIESLLRTQENLRHSLQRDCDAIVCDIKKLEEKLYSEEKENEKFRLKAEFEKKKEERRYITEKLDSIESDIKELRKYLAEIQDLQKREHSAHNSAEKDELCKKIIELKDNARNVIKKRTTHRIQINTSIKVEDIDIELNSALQKASRRETLTPDEMEKLNNYFQSEAYKDSWKQFKEKMKTHLETMERIQAAYNKLNKAGLERIAEQIELISKIPEYQKEPETKTAAPEREPQDGETDTQ